MFVLPTAQCMEALTSTRKYKNSSPSLYLNLLMMLTFCAPLGFVTNIQRSVERVPIHANSQLLSHWTPPACQVLRGRALISLNSGHHDMHTLTAAAMAVND